MNATRVSVMFGIVGLAVAALAVVAWKRASAGPPRHIEEASAGEQDREELAALRRDVSSLKRLAAVQAVRSAAVVGLPAASANPRPPRPPVAEQRKAVIAGLEGRLGAEAHDPQWSRTRADEIRGGFATAMPDVNVLSADCATTVCKVVVQHADVESQAGLMEKATEVQSLDVETYFVFDKEASPPRTTLYMGRPGHSLMGGVGR
jgi:hypothetical protein